MTEIDVRTLPPPERHPRLFEAFDALQPGEAFVLVNDHAPLPLLQTFQHQRPGAYEWSWLQDGPKLWRVRIGRRLVHRQDVTTVSDLLGADHDRLDVLFLGARQDWAAGDLKRATARFAEFAVGLRRHIQAEERVLFPAFEQGTGHAPHAGPTAVMRSEHREIEGYLDAIAAALAAREQQEAPELGQLAAMLLAHNRKEEHVLYPLTDRTFPRETLRVLCHHMEAA